MTRRTIVFKDGEKFYASQEFNGDKAEAAGFHPNIGIKADWSEIVELFTGKASVESFKEAVREAEALYGYKDVEVEEMDELPSCEEIWLTTGVFLHLHTKYGEPTVNWAADIAKEYGFRSACTKDTVTIASKNTDGKWTDWFSITIKEDGLVHIKGNNTDQCNIWLYETRPDMTPEKCVEFFKRLSDTVGLLGEDGIKMSTWIDPEDWQAISGVRDAYEDERYTGKKKEEK